MRYLLTLGIATCWTLCSGSCLARVYETILDRQKDTQESPQQQESTWPEFAPQRRITGTPGAPANNNPRGANSAQPASVWITSRFDVAFVGNNPGHTLLGGTGESPPSHIVSSSRRPLRDVIRGLWRRAARLNGNPHLRETPTEVGF